MPLTPLTPKRVLRTFRYAMYFDGVDDYVMIPHADCFNLTNFTLVAWFRELYQSRMSWSSFLCKNSATMYYNPYRLMFRYTDIYTFEIAVWDGTTTKNVGTGTTKDQLWHMVAGTYDLSYLRIYYDGTLRNSSSSNIIPQQNTYPLYTMRWYDQYGRGYIYQILAYSRALSATEISQLYSKPDIPPANGLILWLKADPNYVKDIDNDGIPEWIDLSGYNNHGKIYGATLTKIVKDPISVRQRRRIWRW
jgi:hypothetical protein